MLQSAFYKASYTVLVFLANLVLANLLLPAHFGNINLMVVNASIVHLVTGLGADAMIIHSLTNKKWNLPYALSFALYAFGIQVFIFLLLELLHVQIWDRTLLAQNDKRFFISEILYFIGLIGTERYVTLLYSENKAAIANRLLLLVVSVYIAALLLLKSFHIASFDLLLQLFCVQSLLQGGFLFIVFHRSEKWQGLVKIKWRGLYEVFKMSAIVMITNFIQFLAYRIDFLLLKKFYTDYELGIYAQVNKFANLMWIVPRIFALLLMPKFRHLDPAKVMLVFRAAMISGIALLIVTAIVTNFFYSYFLNPEYATGLPAFYLMLPGYFCWSVVIYFGAYFSWRGLFYKNLLISSFCFIVVVVCDLLLIPGFSIMGAAISNSIAYSATLLVCFVLFSNETGMGFSKIFRPQKDDLTELTKLLK